MKSICVFCGSSSGSYHGHAQEAATLGRLLAHKSITLIYGGAAVGIMGAVADAVLEQNGKVIGVIPEFLSKKEIRHQNLTELITVQSMHQRKQKMAQLSEGFMALPGGFGTLEELCEILTWTQLGLLPHPVGILNVDGYFDHLLKLFDHMVDQGFLKKENREMVIESNHPQRLLSAMEQYQPRPVPKWLDVSET